MKKIFTTILTLDVLPWTWGSITILYGDNVNEVEALAWRIAFGVKYWQERDGSKKNNILFFGAQLEVDKNLLEWLSKVFRIYNNVYLFANEEQLFQQDIESNSIIILKSSEFSMKLTYLARRTKSLFLVISRGYVDVHTGAETVPRWRVLRKWGNKIIKVRAEFDKDSYELFGSVGYLFRLGLLIYPQILWLPEWYWSLETTDWYDWRKGLYLNQVKTLWKNLKAKGGELAKWLRQDLED